MKHLLELPLTKIVFSKAEPIILPGPFKYISLDVISSPVPCYPALVVK